MANFLIPGDVITKVSAFGAPAPASGFFPVVFGPTKAHPTKAGSLELELSFETGFSCRAWLNSAHDAEGNPLPGLTDKQIRGRTGAIKSVFLSAGFTNEDMARGVTDEWLNGRAGYIEWHSAEDLGAEYGEVAAYYTKEQYDSLVAKGIKPSVVRASDSAGASAGGAQAAPAGAQAASLPPAPATAAPAPTGGPALPPPPSAVTA